MGLIRRALFWVVVAVIVNAVIKLYLTLDTNKRQFNHAPGRCRLVAGIKDGSEDIELLPDGTALISSGLRYTNVSELKGVVGKIFMYESAKTDEEKEKNPVATELKIVSKTLDFKAFNPHGISSFTDTNGKVYLYVINHLPDGDTIERFDFDKEKKSLTHSKSIKHPLIYAGNNLVMTGLDKFFVTNDHYFRNEWLRKVELILAATLGNIVFYDGKDARVVDQWLLSPNGINADKARKQLYVSLVQAKTLRVYDIQKDMNITYKKDVKLHTCTDNLFVDPETGDIWGGAHPVTYEVIQYMDHPKTHRAPSQVVRIRLAKKDGESDYFAEPYGNDGSVLSGSSIAARYKNQILIGTVYDKLLLCDILDSELI